MSRLAVNRTPVQPHLLPPGRLIITCIQATHVRTRADNDLNEAALAPHLLFQLQNGSKSLSIKSNPGQNQGHDVNFGHSTVSLDIDNPHQFLIEEVVLLSIKLQDDSEDVGLIGEAQLDINKILSSQYEFVEDLKVLRPGDTTTNCRVRLKFLFERARVGMLKLNLTDIDDSLIVQASTPDQSKSVAIKDINDSIDFWVDSKNWFSDLSLVLHQEGDESKSVVLTPLPLIGFDAKDRAKVTSNVPVMVNSIESLALISLDIQHEFMEAGQVNIESIQLSNLPSDVSSSLQNLRILLTSRGKVHENKKMTDVPMIDDSKLLWKDVVSLPVVDDYTMLLECCEYDEIAQDYEVVGVAEISLLPLFRDGRMETTVGMKHLTELGDALDAGVLHLTATFDPPKGVAFPQDQPTMTSYIYVRSEDREEKESQLIEEDQDGAFTQEDIKKAFDLFDLDKNGYIGASELRHLLIFMGEHVTDEEVDMMISMLDMNGDGQVSYREFKAMAESDDPSREDFLSDQYNKQALAAPTMSPEARLKHDLTSKKLEVFARCIRTCNIDTFACARMWDILRAKAFKDHTNVTSKSFFVGYDEFCDLMPVVSTTSESHLIYDLIKGDDSSVDGRELVMSFSNFVGFSHEDKCRLAFDMYDIDRSGFLSLDEVEALLMATHLKTRDAIKRRAETVMKSADTDETGDITVDELIVASEKFPSLIFPDHAKQAVTR